MTTNMMTGIRFFSEMNTWLDFLVIVPDMYVDDAAERIKSAIAEYWSNSEDTDDCYGDLVEYALSDLPFTIIYMDDIVGEEEMEENDEDRDESKWDEYLATLEEEMNIITLD